MPRVRFRAELRVRLGSWAEGTERERWTSRGRGDMVPSATVEGAPELISHIFSRPRGVPGVNLLLFIAHSLGFRWRRVRPKCLG
jgi:hypothetical protein